MRRREEKRVFEEATYPVFSFSHCLNFLSLSLLSLTNPDPLILPLLPLSSHTVPYAFFAHLPLSPLPLAPPYSRGVQLAQVFPLIWPLSRFSSALLWSSRFSNCCLPIIPFFPWYHGFFNHLPRPFLGPFFFFTLPFLSFLSPLLFHLLLPLLIAATDLGSSPLLSLSSFLLFFLLSFLSKSSMSNHHPPSQRPSSGSQSTGRRRRPSKPLSVHTGTSPSPDHPAISPRMAYHHPQPSPSIRLTPGGSLGYPTWHNRSRTPPTPLPPTSVESPEEAHPRSPAIPIPGIRASSTLPANAPFSPTRTSFYQQSYTSSSSSPSSPHHGNSVSDPSLHLNYASDDDDDDDDAGNEADTEDTPFPLDLERLSSGSFNSYTFPMNQHKDEYFPPIYDAFPDVPSTPTQESRPTTQPPLVTPEGLTIEVKGPEEIKPPFHGRRRRSLSASMILTPFSNPGSLIPSSTIAGGTLPTDCPRLRRSSTHHHDESEVGSPRQPVPISHPLPTIIPPSPGSPMHPSVKILSADGSDLGEKTAGKVHRRRSSSRVPQRGAGNASSLDTSTKKLTPYGTQEEREEEDSIGDPVIVIGCYTSILTRALNRASISGSIEMSRATTSLLVPHMPSSVSSIETSTSLESFNERANRTRKKLDRFFGEVTPLDVSLQDMDKHGLRALLSQGRIPLCYFLRFLLEEYACENLFFYMEVDHYESYNFSSRLEAAAAAQQIIDTYISPDSPYEVNLTEKTRLVTLELARAGDARSLRRAFSSPKAATLTLLEDGFLRFQASGWGRRMRDELPKSSRIYDAATEARAVGLLLDWLRGKGQGGWTGGFGQREAMTQELVAEFCRSKFNVECSVPLPSTGLNDGSGDAWGRDSPDPLAHVSQTGGIIGRMSKDGGRGDPSPERPPSGGRSGRSCHLEPDSGNKKGMVLRLKKSMDALTRR